MCRQGEHSSGSARRASAIRGHQEEQGGCGAKQAATNHHAAALQCYQGKGLQISLYSSFVHIYSGLPGAWLKAVISDTRSDMILDMTLEAFHALQCASHGA